MAVFVRCGWPFNYDADMVSVETGVFIDSSASGEDMTQQEFKEESDINEIVRRFGITGQLPDNPRIPVSGDFEDVVDFHSAMNAVRAAEEGFMELPADLRAKFHNDPQELMDFCADGKNFEAAKALGLLKADAVLVAKPDVGGAGANAPAPAVQAGPAT